MDDTLKRATNLWGSDFHHLMAIEECAELIQALTHYRRGRCGIEKVLEEVADVIILCRQLSVDNGVELVDEIIATKLARLEKRILENDPNLKEQTK